MQTTNAKRKCMCITGRNTTCKTVNNGELEFDLNVRCYRFQIHMMRDR